MKFIYRIGLLSVLLFFASVIHAQGCPAGIPSGGNLHCIPPDRPESPYYNGSQAYVIPQQPKIVQGHWSDRWGAIAGDGVAGALGFVTGYRSKYLAERAAIKECLLDGGKDCKTSLSFSNQCAAFVFGKNGGYSARAAEGRTAEKLAMSQCTSMDKGCQPLKTACSMAEVEYPSY